MNTQNFFDLDRKEKESWSEKTWEVYNTITIEFQKEAEKIKHNNQNQE